MFPPNSKTYRNHPANPAYSPEQNSFISLLQNHPNMTAIYCHFINEKFHYCRFYSNFSERNSAVSAGLEGFNYRYHFNNKETDNEVIGEGNSYDFGARMYDSRLGRWMSVDPESKMYPNISSYCSFMNNPTYFTDLEGKVLKDKNGKIIYTIPKNDKTEKRNFFGKDGKQYEVVFHPVDIYSNDGEKIRVYYTTVMNLTDNEKVKNQNYQFFYNCHGLAYLDGAFNAYDYNGAQTLIKDKMGIKQDDKIVDNLKTDFSKIKDGDIIIYTNSSDNPVHSAVWSASENKFITKNGMGEITLMDKNQIDELYNSDNAYRVGYFTPVEDKKINAKGKKGQNVFSSKFRENKLIKLLKVVANH